MHCSGLNVRLRLIDPDLLVLVVLALVIALGLLALHHLLLFARSLQTTLNQFRPYELKGVQLTP
jgi:hypothetical protein